MCPFLYHFVFLAEKEVYLSVQIQFAFNFKSFRAGRISLALFRQENYPMRYDNNLADINPAAI